MAIMFFLVAAHLAVAQDRDRPIHGTDIKLSAKQIAVEVAQNELRALTYGPPYLRYRMHTVDTKGDQVRDVIQSKNGPVARLILKEGKMLTPEEDAAERGRLQAMIDAPDAFAKHAKENTTGKRMAAEMITAMPNAMTYSFVEGQPQRARGNGEVVIDFRPDPGFSPSSMAAGALAGLEGRMWVDAKTHCLTRMEGSVFRGVNLGMGLFAHIYPGGTLSFEQAEEIPGRWVFTRFVQHVTVRALLVKTMRENSDIQASDFSAVNPMSYQDAIHALLATQAPGR